MVRLKYGNTHRMVKKPAKCTQTGYLKKHKWSVYLKSLDPTLSERELIEYAVIKLDEKSFGTDQVILNKAPFKFTSAGWGCFEVPIIIFWKPWTKQEPTVLKHMLHFQDKGKTSFLNIAVNLKNKKSSE